MKGIRIIPLAADSTGNRSMATMVETRDVSILVDPSCHVADYRYGLPPHPLELWALEKHRERIRLFARSADLIILLHHYYDVLLKDEKTLFKNKTLLIKNPNQNLSPVYRNHAFALLGDLQRVCREVYYIDQRQYSIGGTTLFFSGSAGKRSEEQENHALHLAVTCNEDTFLFSSEFQKHTYSELIAFMRDHPPDTLYLDGPATYLQAEDPEGYRLDRVMDDLKTMVDSIAVRTMILDHSLMRDVGWQMKIKPFFQFIKERPVVVQSAAAYRGDPVNPLEARRQELHEADPRDRNGESAQFEIP